MNQLYPLVDLYHGSNSSILTLIQYGKFRFTNLPSMHAFEQWCQNSLDRTYCNTGRPCRFKITGCQIGYCLTDVTLPTADLVADEVRPHPQPQVWPKSHLIKLSVYLLSTAFPREPAWKLNLLFTLGIALHVREAVPRLNVYMTRSCVHCCPHWFPLLQWRQETYHPQKSPSTSNPDSFSSPFMCWYKHLIQYMVNIVSAHSF